MLTAVHLPLFSSTGEQGQISVTHIWIPNATTCLVCIGCLIYVFKEWKKVFPKQSLGMWSQGPALLTSGLWLYSTYFMDWVLLSLPHIPPSVLGTSDHPSPQFLPSHLSSTEYVGWGGGVWKYPQEGRQNSGLKGKQFFVLSVADSNGFLSKTTPFRKNMSKLFIALSPSSASYHF